MTTKVETNIPIYNTIPVQISYVAFIFGHDLLHRLLDNSEMACDEAYDYCHKLSEEFYGSKYDDPCKPIYECIEEFLEDNMWKIKNDILNFMRL